ncbi:hypothetical protein K474DRAFT_1588318, partial [Panus rudis PR-1116 ss-1]
MSACYKDTRQGTLENIENWLVSDDSELIFWLFGPPGSGKTAIAKSVSSYVQKRGILAATFFFSVRIGQGCSDGTLLFPTLAYQLASFDSSFKSTLCLALKRDPDLARRSIDVQFRRLFVQPLLSMRRTEIPLVIVLDGLDECVDHGLMQDILRTITSSVSNLHGRVKLFVTSRPEWHITRILKHEEGNHVLPYNLQEMESGQATRDITVYLQNSLHDIAQRRNWGLSWPSEDELTALITAADGLFIYATTLVRFADRARMEPHDILRILVG